MICLFRRYVIRFLLTCMSIVPLVFLVNCAQGPPRERPQTLVRFVDLDVGKSQTVRLHDGAETMVKLVTLNETTDNLRQAVRRAEVTVEVNGEQATLVSATYHLPVTVGGVQIDCPVTKGYTVNARSYKDEEDNAWGLKKDARLRLWPAGSPWTAPGTFVYPVKQRWFASYTQMANEPTYVDGGEEPSKKNIYYHYGLDFGGAEGLTEIVSASAGLVVSVGEAVLPGDHPPVSSRYDVVYIRDDRGWYYRYSHMSAINPDLKVGGRIEAGQAIGILGKEGGSGGWSHQHFDITTMMPSGEWGIQDGYAYIWEAYRREHQPQIIAVARPHQVAWVGEAVTLDGARSWSSSAIAEYQWTLHDGTVETGATITRTYDQPGTYSEVLKITDGAGRVAYDCAPVQIYDQAQQDQLPPTIHPTYHPTFGLQAGDEVTFTVRIFRTEHGEETWDFGDGSPPVTVHSEGGGGSHNPQGYALTTHRYDQPGHYIATVERTNERGQKAVARLYVPVGVEE